MATFEYQTKTYTLRTINFADHDALASHLRKQRLEVCTSNMSAEVIGAIIAAPVMPTEVVAWMDTYCGQAFLFNRCCTPKLDQSEVERMIRTNDKSFLLWWSESNPKASSPTLQKPDASSTP